MAKCTVYVKNLNGDVVDFQIEERILNDPSSFYSTLSQEMAKSKNIRDLVNNAQNKNVVNLDEISFPGLAISNITPDYIKNLFPHVEDPQYDGRLIDPDETFILDHQAKYNNIIILNDIKLESSQSSKHEILGTVFEHTPIIRVISNEKPEDTIKKIVHEIRHVQNDDNINNFTASNNINQDKFDIIWNNLKKFHKNDTIAMEIINRISPLSIVSKIKEAAAYGLINTESFLNDLSKIIEPSDSLFIKKDYNPFEDTPFIQKGENLLEDYNAWEDFNKIQEETPDWKQHRQKMAEFALDYIKDIKDKQNMEIGLAIPLTDDLQLYNLKPLSIIQAPFYEYKSDGTKPSIDPKYADNTWPKILGSAYNTSLGSILSYKTIFNILNKIPNKTPAQLKLYEQVTKDYHGRPSYDIIKGYPLINMSKGKNGESIAKIAYKFKDATVIDIPTTDIKAFRPYIGKYKPLELSTEGKQFYHNRIDKVYEEHKDVIKYEKPAEGEKFDWEGDNEFFNNIEFQYKNKPGSFIDYSRIGKDSIYVKGSFGNMSPLAKYLMSGDIVKVSVGKEGKKHDMQWAVVVDNGAGGTRVIYKEGTKYKDISVSHNLITSLIFAKYQHNDIFNELNDSKASLSDISSKDDFVKYIQGIYKDPTLQIEGFGAIAYYNKLEDENPSAQDIKDNNLETLNYKKAMLQRIKPLSLVRYIIKDSNGNLSPKLGRFAFSDDTNIHIYPTSQIGNEKLVAIPIKNSAGYGWKNNKYEFDPVFADKTSLAMDSFFVDIKEDIKYLNYLKNKKDGYEENFNKKESKDEDDFDPNNNIKDPIVEKNAEYWSNLQNNLKPEEFKKQRREYIQSLGDNYESKKSKSIDDDYDVVRFLKYDTDKDKSIIKGEIVQLMSIHDKLKELSNIKIGDLILDYNPKTGYNKWHIVVDKTSEGFPIVPDSVKNKADGKLKRKTLYPDKIKALAKQLHTQMIDPNDPNSVYIEGRPEILIKREKAKQDFISSDILETSYNENEAKEVVKQLNNRVTAKLKKSIEPPVTYRMEPKYLTKKSNGEIFWSAKKPTSKNEQATIEEYQNAHPGEKVEQLYTIRRKFKGSEESNHDQMIRKIDLENSAVYSAYKYDFDTVRSGVRVGSIIDYYRNIDGKYQNGIMRVTKIKEGSIHGESYHTDGDGNSFVKAHTIYKIGNYPTIINGIYRADYKKFIEGTELKDTKSITLPSKKSIARLSLSSKNNNIVKFDKIDYINIKTKKFKTSLELNKFTKTRDTKSAIKNASDRLTEIYGIKSNLYDNETFSQFGSDNNIDLSNARGLILNREIHINAEKASIAESFHELAHMIVPGLKVENPKLWDIMMEKIQDNPLYDTIAENYPSLSKEDLDEEVFVTIFGEYYRGRLLNENESNWIDSNPEFNELSEKSINVINNIFNTKLTKEQTLSLIMNKNINDIFNDFGDAMLTGLLKKYVNDTESLENNNHTKGIINRLFNEGKLIKMC